MSFDAATLASFALASTTTADPTRLAEDESVQRCKHSTGTGRKGSASHSASRSCTAGSPSSPNLYDGSRQVSPFTCALCGIRLRNDEDTVWLGPSWDGRDPYCLDCAPSIERDLAEKGI